MFKRLALIAILSLSWVTYAFAAYPTSTVTIVVPFPAGQAGDLIARLLGTELSNRLGQAFVIENKPGAGGRVGTALAARSKNDGYTLLMTSTGPFAIAPALYADTIQYDPLKDFVGIAEAAATPQILAVSNQSGIQSIQQLIEQAKSKDLSYASAGSGSTQHLTMELLKIKFGVPMVHVPFKGSPESKTQIMSGLIPVTSDSLPPILPQIKANQMKALAVIDVERSPYLPDIPTLAELGYPGIASVAFFGLVAPKGTPVEAINILNKNIREILKLPAVQEKFKEQALTLPKPRDAAEFNKYLASEVAKWKKIVVDSNVKVE